MSGCVDDLVVEAPAVVGPDVVVRRHGIVDYEQALNRMRAFTQQRGRGTADEIWLMQHLPVYTLGQSCTAFEYPGLASIPVVRSDRGGKVTYHGPGQSVAYVLIDLRRRGWNIRQYVWRLEQAALDLAGAYGLAARRVDKAPGAYVEGRKFASLGLRVRAGRAYHGLSVNIAMDLAPFRCIDPCGFRGLEVTDLRQLGVVETFAVVENRLLDCLQAVIGGSGAGVNQRR